MSKDKIQDNKSKLLNEFKYNLDTFEKVNKLPINQTKNLKISYKQPV